MYDRIIKVNNSSKRSKKHGKRKKNKGTSCSSVINSSRETELLVN